MGSYRDGENWFRSVLTIWWYASRQKIMARTQIHQTKEPRYHADRIAGMCAQLVQLVDDVLTTDPWIREASDVRSIAGWASPT